MSPGFRASDSAKMPSQRQLRVGEVIRKDLTEIFRQGDAHLPELEAFSITVSEVRASADMKNATVFISVLGGGDAPVLLELLHEAAPMLRSLLFRRLRMKSVPRLRFRMDQSFDEADHINRLLHDEKVRRDLEKPEE